MPSFDFDDATAYPPQRRAPFEPLGELRTLHEKANGNLPLTRRPTKESYDTSLDLTLDSHSIDSFGVNGDMHNDSSVSATSHGRLSVSSWDNRSSRDGSTLSNNGSTNGYTENVSKGHAMPNGLSKSASMDRGSVASVYGASVVPVTNGDAPAKPLVNGSASPMTKNNAAGQPSANPLSTGPLTYTDSLMPPSSVEPHTTTQPASPHRFSSPPAYPAPTPPNASSTATPGNLIVPGPSQLKHRHTLQVPRVGAPGRNSRDSAEDAAHTTGRFSPTGTQRGSSSLNRRNTRSIHSELPHEEVPPDEDAQRWAEAIRQKRASKRRRKDEEDEDRVVVGTKVDINHVNWVTAYNMLTGIRFTVSRTNAKIDRPLTDADFEARHKFSFDITGNELTPSAKYDFKFKDYAPWVFRHLRANFRLDPADYLISLTSKYILSELGSPGKSGSFFYFSRDYKYIIKTIHHAEHKFLRKILKDYYHHVENNPNTLLSQFYGLHRVKIPYGRKIHFVVMNNLFPPHRDIHQTFDLKGSTIGRDFREEDLEKNPRATLKDLNWTRRHLHLEFGPDKKRLFIEQMERDVQLLEKLHIMDYSMLVGIHDLHKGNQENLRDKTLQVFHPGGDNLPEEPVSSQALMRTPSKLESSRKARELRQMIKQEKPIPMGLSNTRIDQMEENTTKKDFLFYSDDGGFQATHEDNRPGDEIYYLGIIDCLTHYGTIKRLENFWKGLSHDKQQISPVPSVPYGERFINFINGVTKTREEAEREAAAKAAAAEQEASMAGLDGSADVPRRQPGPHPTQRPEDGKSAIQNSEHEAAKSDRDFIPDRTISTVRSPSVDQNNERTGMTLPIVDEVGESSSTCGRSLQGAEDEEDRPPTPPKDDNHLAASLGASLRRKNSSTSLNSNKELPPLPLASALDKLASPREMKLKEAIFR